MKISIKCTTAVINYLGYFFCYLQLKQFQFIAVFFLVGNSVVKVAHGTHHAIVALWVGGAAYLATQKGNSHSDIVPTF